MDTNCDSGVLVADSGTWTRIWVPALDPQLLKLRAEEQFLRKILPPSSSLHTGLAKEQRYPSHVSGHAAQAISLANCHVACGRPWSGTSNNAISSSLNTGPSCSLTPRYSPMPSSTPSFPNNHIQKLLFTEVRNYQVTSRPRRSCQQILPYWRLTSTQSLSKLGIAARLSFVPGRCGFVV